MFERLSWHNQKCRTELWRIFIWRQYIVILEYFWKSRLKSLSIVKQSHFISEYHFQNLELSDDIEDIKINSTRCEYPFVTATGFELTTT